MMLRHGSLRMGFAAFVLLWDATAFIPGIAPVCLFNLRKAATPYSALHCRGTSSDSESHSPSLAQTTSTGQNVSHVRRKRYVGTHPQRFEEKYKERRGDQDIVSKVISKGGCPAGQHRPIMLEECMTFMGLDITDAQLKRPVVCIDCTVGFGGHSTEILRRISPRGGHLYALDRDGTEIVKTEARLRQLLHDLTSTHQQQQQQGQQGQQQQGHHEHAQVACQHLNFGELESFTKNVGIHGHVTALLADLGFSSMQIDDPQRGFTYKSDGPLDMRMDTSKGETAAQLLGRVTVAELTAMLRDNSDEPYADAIAAAVLAGKPPATTAELSNRVRTAVADAAAQQHRAPPPPQPRRGSAPFGHRARLPPPPPPPPPPGRRELDAAAARAMQAIRIAVNEEFGALEALLKALPGVLAPGGRAAVLTFHSGEDRRVKKAFQEACRAGIYSEWGRRVVVASPQERGSNPRARCAKLRWAVRAGP